MTQRPMKRKRRSKKSRDYFTHVHEQAIKDFITAETKTKQNQLYIQVIAPVFEEMIDKIVMTYKFNNLPNVDLLKVECAVYLSTVLTKYNPERAKAFSYFSVIVRNWFTNQAKLNKKRLDREIDLGDISKAKEKEFLSLENPYEENRERDEFLSALHETIEEWGEQPLKENEKKVLQALKILLEAPDDIEIFNKKAIYLHFREITRLNTKQIIQALKKFQKSYGEFKHEWKNVS